MPMEHAFTFMTAVVGPHVVGEGLNGLRHHYEMIDGTIDGPRISATMLGSGADRMLVGADGSMRMDVRVQYITDDGAVVCASYIGMVEPSERLRRAIERFEKTAFEEQSIRTSWTLECPRHAWVNGAILVGEGRFRPFEPRVAGFEHRIYHVA